jgi:hypothetical protein
LVESCENFVRANTKKRSADTAMVLVAMTPAILDGASHFYNARGFVEHQENNRKAFANADIPKSS